MLSEQDVQIEQVGDDMLQTNANVAQANDEIKKATKSGSDLRWIVVFILLVCSASLLFLDWRNQAYVPPPPPIPPTPLPPAPESHTDL